MQNIEEISAAVNERVHYEQQTHAPLEPDIKDDGDSSNASDQDNKSPGQAESGARKGSYFTDADGYLYRLKQTKEGPVPMRLANFDARITEEVIEDNGQDVTTYYTIQGKAGSYILPSIETPASQFNSMNWLHKWGTVAIIEPGQSSKDYVRHAIQVQSQGEIKKRLCYTHTGWRNISGQWVYLSNTGAIGLDDVSVKMSRECARYSLPLQPSDELEAIRTSLSFLDIGKKEITLPLYAITFLAPLTTLLNPMPNFSSYVYGQTGTFKSTISLLQLAHFGSFASISGLNNFDDSANSIEKRAFTLKDTLLVLDDYHPSHRRQDAQAKESLAQRLIRSFSNRTARGRLNSDTTDKGRYEPRGMLQITGEELVSLPSTLARLLVVEMEPGDIDTNKLTGIQQQEHLLPHAMASFLLWVRDRISTIQSSFPTRFTELRNAAAQNGDHRKIPEQTAFLFYALKLVSRWLEDKGIFTADQASDFLSEAWGVLIALAKKQSRRVDEDSPVKLYSEILNALLTSGRHRLDHTITGDQMGGGEILLGYYDENYCYFLPTPTWHAVNQYCIQAGNHFPHGKNALYKMLKTSGFLIPSKNENLSQLKHKGKTLRVIKLCGAYLKSDVTDVTED